MLTFVVGHESETMSLQNPSYLTLSRHNIYYFRWPLPEALRVKGRTAHIKLSLQTRDPKEALRLANMLAYHADVIVKSDCVGGMDYIEVKSLLEAYFVDLLAEQKRLIDKDGPLSQPRIQRLKRNIAYVQDNEAYESGEQFMRMLSQGKIAVVRDGDTIENGERPTSQGEYVSDVQNILNTFDMDLAVQSIGYQRVKDLFRPAALAYFERLIEYSESQKQFNFDAPVNGMSVIDARPMAGFTRPEHRLKNVVAKYVAEMDRAQAWGIRAKEERQDCFDYLSELLGEGFNFASMDVAKARYIKETLSVTPANRRKMKQTRDLPLMAQIEVEGVAKLSVGSINKYLQCYSTLYSWAVKNGYIDKNPFEGLSIKDKGRDKKKRDWFRPEQIKAMLAELDKGKDGLADNDMKYWGALIGIYTGARLNEIASLTVNDIKHDADTGIWFFDINDEDEKKRLKTHAATRHVPVHSALLKRGFLEYVERVSKMDGEDTRLLYALTYSAKEGWGRKLTRWFSNTFLPRLGLKKADTSFHSLRHSTITVMRRGGVDNPTVRALVGHEPDGVTEEVYTHGYELGQLKEAIERLDF
jgi:integrase